MLLSEAKEILKNNGYKLKLNESKQNFRQWYTEVADEIELAGYDEIILSKAMEVEDYSRMLVDMWEDNVSPKEVADWVINNT